MKVKKIIRKMYRAIFNKDKQAEKKYYFKLLKKSLKHKNTTAVR